MHRELQLERNHLTGVIPASLYSLSKLTLLDLSSNVLNGSISDAISQLTALTYGGLLRYCDELSSTCHTFATNICSGRILRIAANPDLAGTVPTTLTTLSQLQYVAIGRCYRCHWSHD